jgi:hypothetical protein
MPGLPLDASSNRAQTISVRQGMLGYIQTQISMTSDSTAGAGVHPMNSAVF